jgi:hypothetical protein
VKTVDEKRFKSKDPIDFDWSNRKIIQIR